MKFLITAAGSGGHIYPALSLADKFKLKDDRAQIIFLSSRKSIDKKIFKQIAEEVFALDFISPQRKTGVNHIKFCLKNLYFLLKFSKESIKAFFLIQSIKPDIVIGFGGIGSVSAILSARLLNIPCLIHEQNAVPGLANRLLGRFASKVATGFRESNKHFKTTNIVFTGNPLRADLKKIDSSLARTTLDLDIEKFTILIVGGSQGAIFINDCFLSALGKLSEQKHRRLQVIHCCGSRNFININKKYENIKLKSRVFAYCDDMSSAYSAADLIIGRSGAATLNEICFFGKASILIPYPYAQAHQIANAQFMQEAQAATLINQNAMADSHIASLINLSMDQPQLLDAMGEKSKQLFSENCADKLADLALGLIRK